LLAAPVLMVAAAGGEAVAVPLLLALPFVTGAWFGVTMLRARAPKRRAWLYVLSQGFHTYTDPPRETLSARWAPVEGVREIWSSEIDVTSQESESRLTGYELALGDGRRVAVSRFYRNMMDPYASVGRMLAGLMPRSVGEVIPRFPVIDDIITTYA